MGANNLVARKNGLLKLFLQNDGLRATLSFNTIDHCLVARLDGLPIQR